MERKVIKLVFFEGLFESYSYKYKLLTILYDLSANQSEYRLYKSNKNGDVIKIELVDESDKKAFDKCLNSIDLDDKFIILPQPCGLNKYQLDLYMHLLNNYSYKTLIVSYKLEQLISYSDSSYLFINDLITMFSEWYTDKKKLIEDVVNKKRTEAEQSEKVMLDKDTAPSKETYLIAIQDIGYENFNKLLERLSDKYAIKVLTQPCSENGITVKDFQKDVVKAYKSGNYDYIIFRYTHPLGNGNISLHTILPLGIPIAIFIRKQYMGDSNYYTRLKALSDYNGIMTFIYNKSERSLIIESKKDFEQAILEYKFPESEFE